MALVWPRPSGRACLMAVVVSVLSLQSAQAQTTAAPAQAPPAVPAPPVAAVGPEQKLAGNAQRTRFLIGLEKPVQFQVFSLSNPNRVVVELPDVKAVLPTHPGEKAIGLVKSFRGGVAAQDKMRVVIDVTEPVIVASSAIEKSPDGRGHRLALEIVPVTAADKSKAGKKIAQPFALGGAAMQPPLPQRAVSPKLKAEKAYKPIVVIDPGHGGHDSGAQKNGAVEKEVVLAFGLALRDKLNKTGKYTVLMTRDTDKFVELDERVAFAERNSAALFIAVHADYAGSNASGATIYSLRDGVAQNLKRSAKDAVTKTASNSAKKAVDDKEMVRDILEDLAKQEVEANRGRSKLFAGTVIENMSDATSMRSSPDQQATFRVLKTAQLPSVLIELAYVTNKKDAANLKSEEWRSSVAESIATAVENYFSHKFVHLPM